MPFDPLNAFLEKCFAQLACASGEERQDLLSYRHKSDADKRLFCLKLAIRLGNAYHSVTGDRLDVTGADSVKNNVALFMDNYTKLSASANIQDINTILRRRKRHHLKRELTLSETISDIHASIFGVGVVEEVARLHTMGGSDMPNTVDDMLTVAEGLEESLREHYDVYDKEQKYFKALAEETKRYTGNEPAIAKPDEDAQEAVMGAEPAKATVQVDAATNVGDKLGELSDETIEVVKDLKDGVIKKLFAIISDTISNAVETVSAPVEVHARGKRTAIAAAGMGFLNPEFDIKSNFKSYAAFMLMMMDLYPLSNKTYKPIQAKERFAQILLKPSLDDHDMSFISELYDHLRKNITRTANVNIERFLDISYSSGTEPDMAAVNVALSLNKSSLETLDKIIDSNDILGRDIKSTVNSRLIAQFIQPLLRNHFEYDTALIDTLTERYKSQPGVSKLAICEEISHLREHKSFDGEASLNYLRRIRPTGDLEQFAYASPDTNMPMIRALNNIHNIGGQVALLTKLVTSSDYEELVEKGSKLKDWKDVIKYGRDIWHKGGVNISSIARNLIPNASLVKRSVHGLIRNRTLYLSEMAETLQKGCGDLAKFDMTSPGALNRTDAIRLLDILLASAERHVTDNPVNETRDAIFKLRENIDISDTEISSIVASVITPEIKQKFLNYQTINSQKINLISSNAPAQLQPS